MKRTVFSVLFTFGFLAGCGSYRGSKSVAWGGGKLAIAGAAIAATGCLLALQHGSDLDIAFGTVVTGAMIGVSGAVVSGMGLAGMAYHAIDGFSFFGQDGPYSMPLLPASTVSRATSDDER